MARYSIVFAGALLTIGLVFMEWFSAGRYSWTRLRTCQTLYNTCRLGAILSLRSLDDPPKAYPPGHVSFPSSVLISILGYCFSLWVFSNKSRHRIAAYTGNDTITCGLGQHSSEAHAAVRRLVHDGWLLWQHGQGEKSRRLSGGAGAGGASAVLRSCRFARGLYDVVVMACTLFCCTGFT